MRSGADLGKRQRIAAIPRSSSYGLIELTAAQLIGDAEAVEDIGRDP